jgi:NAD(P)H-dependent FMN reductase
MRLLVSGSPGPLSANSRLLVALGQLGGTDYLLADYLADLPVFQPGRDKAPWPEGVIRWRKDVASAGSVIFSTPAYLHNIPGVLKNALEWLTSSGELDAKPCLVFTLTPGAPRGERARQSLLWSLEALNARVVAEGGLYQPEIKLAEDGHLTEGEERQMLEELLALL